MTENKQPRRVLIASILAGFWRAREGGSRARREIRRQGQSQRKEQRPKSKERAQAGSPMLPGADHCRGARITIHEPQLTTGLSSAVHSATDFQPAASHLARGVLADAVPVFP